jgi:phosphoglucosamine mutase
MTRKYFGTDGIRGTVGQAPITPDFVLRLAHAVGRVLRRAPARPTVLIGKDTRISGYMLESALESGFNSAGVDVVLLGPVPTPAVAYLTRAQRASAGRGDQRQPQRLPRQRHQVLQRPGHQAARRLGARGRGHAGRAAAVGDSAALGRARRLDDAAGRYIEFCKSSFSQRPDAARAEASWSTPPMARPTRSRPRCSMNWVPTWWPSAAPPTA